MDSKDAKDSSGSQAVDAVEYASPAEKQGGDEMHEATLPAEDGPWWPFLVKRWPMIWRMAVIYIAVLNVGFDMSVGNTTLGMASFRKYFGYYDAASDSYKIQSVYQSAWMGGTSAGQIVMDL